MNVPSRHYDRTCSKCGDISTVTYKPKGHELCRLCRGKEQAIEMIGKNKKPIEEHKRYVETCSECGITKTIRAPRKGTLCGDCNRLAIGKANKGKIRKRPVKKQYMIVCPHCVEGEGIRYSYDKRRCGIYPCRKHMYMDRPEKVKKIKKKKRSPSIVGGIDGKQKVNIKKKVTTVKKIETPEEMIKRFLKTNKVTVIEPSTSAQYILRESYND